LRVLQAVTGLGAAQSHGFSKGYTLNFERSSAGRTHPIATRRIDLDHWHLEATCCRKSGGFHFETSTERALACAWLAHFNLANLDNR
jgi:hypothetical protein